MKKSFKKTLLMSFIVSSILIAIISFLVLINVLIPVNKDLPIIVFSSFKNTFSVIVLYILCNVFIARFIEDLERPV